MKQTLYELKPTNLVLAVVPEEASEFRLSSQGYKYMLPKCIVLTMDKNLNSGTHTFLGCVYADGRVDFDPEKYVEVLASFKADREYKLFMNYKNQKPVPVSMTCGTSHQSLLSLIESNGLYLKNPIAKPEELTSEEFYGASAAGKISYENKRQQYANWMRFESLTLPQGCKGAIMEIKK